MRNRPGVQGRVRRIGEIVQDERLARVEFLKNAGPQLNRCLAPMSATKSGPVIPRLRTFRVTSRLAVAPAPDFSLWQFASSACSLVSLG
jgi:hypothetical protein